MRNTEEIRRHFSLTSICRMLEISPQGYYQHERLLIAEAMREELILQLVRNIRKRQPKIGVRKIYHILQPELQALEYSFGRDKLFALLSREGLLVRRKPQYCRTTNSHHRFRVYTNLIAEIAIERVNQVWVADITYIRTKRHFLYLSLVTDYYSRMIIGYSLSDSLSIEGSMTALEMAQSKSSRCVGVIHHSDRGVQYCSTAYTERLYETGARISMGERGNPYENAVAERVNGILKTEFLLYTVYEDDRTALRHVKEAIAIYNNERPHMSLRYMVPSEVYRLGVGHG